MISLRHIVPVSFVTAASIGSATAVSGCMTPMLVLGVLHGTSPIAIVVKIAVAAVSPAIAIAVVARMFVPTMRHHP